jgi:hypothetical protein
MSTHPNDLQRLAQKHGWATGPLTSARVKRMGVQEYEFHRVFNKAELEKALAEPQIQAEAKRSGEVEKVQRQWENKATPEETEAALKEVAKFVARHPQFRADLMDNRTKLVDFLKASNLPITEKTLTESFEILGREGKLVLSPAAVGIIRIRLSNGEVLSIRKEDLRTHKSSGNHSYGRDSNVEVLDAEDSVTGSRLSRHVLLDVLLSPYNTGIQSQRDQDGLRADEYKDQNPEAFREPTPALTEQNFLQATATFLSFHPEYIPTEAHRKHLRAYIDKRKLPYNINSLEAAYAELVREGYIETNSEKVVSAGGGTKLIDLGGEYQPHGTKQNLRVTNKVLADVNRMSAQEYLEYLNVPENRREVEAALR